jgi:ATP-dependent exoDNAse (exonuclease V) alpha subunit
MRQQAFFQLASGYLTAPENDGIFVLKGYAGTGKTTVVSTLVAQLGAIGQKAVLLAPTGRAAKVMAQYSGQAAFTIHKKIYFPKKNGSGGIGFTLMPNKHKRTVVIVDEASMISDGASESAFYQGSSLLDDLVTYVYTGQDCRLILLGDTAQLPPVGADISPALDVDGLARAYHMKVLSIEFNEVMRQSEASGILYNATAIRERLEEDLTDFRFDLTGFPDVVRLSDGHDIQDAIQSAYGRYSEEDTAFVVRANKRANQYNQQIRQRILDRESELSAGDLLMVVKNNYFWLEESDQAGFIANGDILEVLEIFGFTELYGFHFARVKVRMVDYPDQRALEVVLLLDTIHSQSPSLSADDANRLYQQVLEDYADERTAYRRMQKVKENPYFNALQVKFSYAITCHKSQGGQWPTVFIEKPYLPEGQTRDYLRWLYTAVTRAQEKLYLIGFGDEDFLGA